MIVDLIQQKFGRLTVMSRGLNDKRSRAAQWWCLCDCGVGVLVRSDCLTTGNTQSCGCLFIDAHTKHGHCSGNKYDRTYTSWRSMLARCINPNSDSWKYYGARGITICRRWQDSFENFLKDMGERPVGMTLDRKNSDGNYTAKNCQWATPYQQIHNRRTKC